MHHDIRTRSRILASRVITCEGTHCLAECSGSAVRACGGRVGGVAHSRAPFVATFLLQGGCPDRRMSPACNPQLFNALPCTCRSQANAKSHSIAKVLTTESSQKLRRGPRPPAARSEPRSLHLAALAAPHSTCSSPRPSPSPGTFVAPAGCSPGLKRPLGPACGLPAGCLPPRAACC